MPNRVTKEWLRWPSDGQPAPCFQGDAVLIKAIKLLVDGGSDVTLDIVGDGPERQSREIGGGRERTVGRVTFHGSLGETEIIEMLRHANCPLWPVVQSRGVVYMKAMAMEVATIGTAAGGVG